MRWEEGVRIDGNITINKGGRVRELATEGIMGGGGMLTDDGLRKQRVAPEQHPPSPKMRTSWHDNCWWHWRGAFNNQQGWQASTEGSGGGADGRTMMLIYQMGAAKWSGWDSATLSSAR